MARTRIVDASLKSAVALAYSETDAAPRVVAKGNGLVAEQIIARAHEHGVYVHESPELVALLLQVDLDQRIPPQLYVAVAELLAWLYRLESSGTNSVNSANLISSGPPAFVAPAKEVLKP